MKKRKVLYVITKSNWGGAQRYVFDLATNLPTDAFEAVVAFGGTGESGAKAGALEKKLHAAGIRTMYIQSFMRNISLIKEIQAFFELVRLFKIEQPDIIHLNSSKAITLGALAGRIAGVPHIVSTVHGWAFNEPRPHIVRNALKGIHWFGTFLSHRTIVVSLHDLHQITFWPLVYKKIVRIHNGIPAFELKEKSHARSYLTSINMALEPHLHDLWIGTNSELHKNKGLDFLLRSFAAIAKNYPQAIVVIISNGEERRNLETLANELSIRERVFFLGYVENAREYVRAFDIFTLTSRKEGLPYAILEAGFAGLPIIASKTGGIPEIIESGVGGLLTPVGDVGSISRAIGDLIEAPALRDDYGSSLRHTIQNEFSLEKMVALTSQLYQEILR